MSGSVLLPFLLAASSLLLGSGAAKLRRPAPAAAALHELGLPAAGRVVAIGAVVELVVGTAMLVRPHLGATAACALSLLFAALVALQLLRGSRLSCGCLGSRDTPPSRLHLVLNLALAGLAAACLEATPHPLESFSRHPFATAVVAVAAATTAWSIAAGLELVPRLLTVYRSPAT